MKKEWETCTKLMIDMMKFSLRCALRGFCDSISLNVEDKMTWKICLCLVTGIITGLLFLNPGIQSNDGQLYELMVNALSPECRNSIQGIINEANRRQQANGINVSTGFLLYMYHHFQ